MTDTASDTRAFISVVVPMFNEEAGAAECVKRLTQVLEGMPFRYEIIFVNDGSRDRTLENLKAQKSANPNIKIVDLSRNFGHQLAITAGIDLAQGDAVIVIDGDLQDPPELFPEMAAKWQEGYDVVHAKRRKREGETTFKLLTAKIYYRLIREIAHVDIPVDVGDFRLMSRRAVDALKSLREKHRYIRGMVAWLGFNQTTVEYDRSARFAGQTHYPLSRMLSFSWIGLTSFSIVPLRLATFCGLLSALAGFLYGIYALIVKYVFHTAIIGWTSIVILILLLGGIQLLCLGIIGEYVGKLYEESKNRPLYLVKDII
jgi:dolichol-phosphate mannosyltransferase